MASLSKGNRALKCIEQNYFLKLFEKFAYITNWEYNYSISLITNIIFEILLKCGIENKEVVFVLNESKYGIKSGRRSRLRSSINTAFAE